MIYLRLFHGRRDPNQEMDNWGSEGPIIGPCMYVHITYGGIIHLGHPIPGKGNLDLYFNDGLVYLDGVYYGDITITTKDVLAKDRLTDKVISLDSAKSLTSIA